MHKLTLLFFSTLLLGQEDSVRIYSEKEASKWIGLRVEPACPAGFRTPLDVEVEVVVFRDGTLQGAWLKNEKNVHPLWKSSIEKAFKGWVFKPAPHNWATVIKFKKKC